MRWEDFLPAAQAIVSAHRAEAPDGFDPQNSGIAAAIIGAAVIGGVAAGVGGAMSAKAQVKAAREAVNAQDRATAANLDMYHQSRGSEGSAILPEYGKETEADIYNRAVASYQAAAAASGGPAEVYQRAAADLQDVLPTFDAGTGLVDSIYSGQMTNRALAAAQPVQEARTAQAAGQKTSLLQAAQDNLNRIKAQYPGASGTFAQKMQLNALAPGVQAAANAEAEARLKNAQEIQAIQNMRDTLGLQYLNVPLDRARQKIGVRLLPTEAVSTTFGAQVAPLSMFNIGVGRPPNIPPLPTAGPIPNAGQIAAAGVGAAANTVGNAYVNNRIAQQMQANQQAANGYRSPGFYQNIYAPTPTWDSSAYNSTYGVGGAGGSYAAPVGDINYSAAAGYA